MASRDLPRTFRDVCLGWTDRIREEVTFNKSKEVLIEEDLQEDEEHKVKKVSSVWPALFAGAGLFSDGYVNNSISTVNTCLSTLYPDNYATSNAIQNVTSIAFVGIVVGMLVFGYISDHIARKGGMMVANIMLIAFTVLCAVGTWGANGSPSGLFAALTTFRFFLGIAIGAEYPTSSVISSEFANQLPAGKRNRYFCWFSNFMIDAGFVVSAFVPMVLLWIFGPHHLNAIWRLTLGLGVFPPLLLFWLRTKMKDSDSFQKLHMKKVQKIPYLLIFKFYWFRISIVSLIWFIYDFSVYSFGLYSTTILGIIIKDGDIYKTWGWNIVLNLFYIPGAFLGALASDYFGPRLTLGVGVIIQAIIGFIMSALYENLKGKIGAFVVIYGIFLTLGELGPGDNIGLLASKTSATPIRGQYYGIAAAFGKIGGFVGTYALPAIMKKYGNSVKVPFYVSSALCVFSGLLALFFLPPVGQDAINREDQDFVAYLEKNGFDISQLGSVVVDHENDDVSDVERKGNISVALTAKDSA